MVKLHVKRGSNDLFLFETTTDSKILDLLGALVAVHNGKLKIERLNYEIEELSKHGPCLPPNMQGLSIEQIKDLNLKDEWTLKYESCLDHIYSPDPMGKRNGLAPSEKFVEILSKSVAEARARISEKLIGANIPLSIEDINSTLDMLKGAVMICYPMELPTYDSVYLEISGKEDLSGTQASKDILETLKTDIWWANKLLEKDKKLSDYIGKNEKSKLVIKLQTVGQGAPSREPVITEQQKRDLMLAEYNRREELKKLDEDDDDSFLDSNWADGTGLKKSFLGLNKIKYK